MDGFHPPRRLIAGDQQQHQPPGGGGPHPPLWYPLPPPSSSSPAAAYQPASASPLHAYHHHPPPHPLHHQPWPPHHPQNPLHPLPPPAYPPYPDSHRYPTPPPRPPHMPPLPHHPPPPPPPPMPPHPSSYPPPTQAWRNPSWPQHQGWEYLERNIAYNNEEDWAARAKAWAAAKSATDSHYTDSQFTPVRRMEEPSHAYQAHYQQAVGAASTDPQQQLHPQAFVQQLSGADLQRRDNQFHGSAISSGLPSYGTDGKDTDNIASPSQRSFNQSASIYEQEVPYSYSYSTGGREVLGQNGIPHMPVQEGLHLQSSLPIPKAPVENPIFAHGRHSVDILNDACNKPLEFESGSMYDNHPHQNRSYGPVDPAIPMEMMNNDAIATSIKSWAPSAASGIAFSQSTAVVSATQIDPSFVSQSSLPTHPAPAFGGIPGPTFPPGILPASTPFGLATGTSIHNAPAFPGDASGAFNLSERPKKAAVPNWLRDEIIKQKSTIAVNVPIQGTGDSFNSMESQDTAKSFKKADHADSRSFDSTRSTEDGDDDEDDVDAARSAAINQEIKRVLTEVLLKVTDELFDEIATKVLNEDDVTTEVDGSTLPETRTFSPSPPAVSTPKASAKVLVPVETRGSKVDSAGENSSLRASGGDILGLADYASDDDGDSETEGSNIPSSGMRRSAFHQQDNGRDEGGKPNGGSIHINEEEDRKEINGVHPGAKKNDVNHMLKNASLSADGSYFHEKSPKKDSGISEVVAVDCENFCELSSENRNTFPKKYTAGEDGQMLGSEIESVKNGESIIEQCEAKELRNISSTNKQSADSSPSRNFIGAKAVIHKKNHSKSEYDDPVSHEIKDKMREKQEKKDAWKDKAQGKIVKREPEARQLDYKSSSHKLDNIKDGRKENAKSTREKGNINDERKSDQPRDKKEDRSARVSKDSVRYNSRRSLSPSNRGRTSKGSSLGGHAGGLSDEQHENSRKRKLQSKQRDLSPSPTTSRIRQVLRSPHSKHSSHSRHSSYSSAERSKRSRSRTPPVHRRSTHKK